MNRSIFLKALLVVVCVVSVGMALSLFIQNIILTSSYENLKSETTSEISDLKEDMAGLETKLKQQSDLLDSRERFLDSLDNAKAALSEASKNTDISASLKLVKESQEVVYQEHIDPHNIVIETEKVNKEAGKLRARIGFLQSNSSLTPEQTITAADLQQEVEGLRTLEANHPARKALDAVGGADIMLGAAPTVCNSEMSMACAYPTGVILLSEASTNEDYDFYYPVMMHEYAHQMQYKYGEVLSRSVLYYELFGNDVEWLADCMAAAKIPGYYSNYQYECSPAQINFGANGWIGSFP